MTTPPEDEARAAAAAAYPDKEWAQPSYTSAFREAFAKGYLAGVASRVSTPPSEPGGCSAHGKRDCTENICDGEWSPETGSFSIRPVTPPSEHDVLNCPGCGYDPMAPHNGKGDCAPATPPTDEDERARECKHYADLYGRCMDCGKTWEQRSVVSTTPADDQSESLADALSITLGYGPIHPKWSDSNHHRAMLRHASDLLAWFRRQVPSTPEPEWEYGTLRGLVDGWEQGDRYGDSQYVDRRSVTDRLNYDPSTVTKARDLTRAVRRRKAGPWEPVPTEGEA